MKAFLLVLILLVLPEISFSLESNKSGEYKDIAEAVLRYEFKHFPKELPAFKCTNYGIHTRIFVIDDIYISRFKDIVTPVAKNNAIASGVSVKPIKITISEIILHNEYSAEAKSFILVPAYSTNNFWSGYFKAIKNDGKWSVELTRRSIGSGT